MLKARELHQETKAVMKSWVALIGITVLIALSPINLRAETFTFAVADNTIDTVVSEVILKKAYRMLGHQIEILRLPAKRALENANAGIYDGDVQRIFNVAKSHTNLIRLEPPINYIHGTGFVNKGAKIDVRSWDDLKKYKVGIILGIRFAETNVPKQNAVIFHNYKKLTAAIATNGIDIGIYPESNGIYQTLFSNEENIVPLETPLAKFELYHYIHKKNHWLTKDLQRIFAEFSKNGTLIKVRQRVLEISFSRARKGLEPCFIDYACYQSVWDD